MVRIANSYDIAHLSLRPGVAGCPRTDQGAEMFELGPEAQPSLESSAEGAVPYSQLYLRVPREWQMRDRLAALLKSRLGPEEVITYDRW